MEMIHHARPFAQPTANRYRVEERTIDANAGQALDLMASPDLLLNPTLTSRDVNTAGDRDGGWKTFHALVATGQYQPGSGKRLVLVEGGDR